jgi:hypothetical protein
MIPRETLQELIKLRERVADLEAEIAMLRDHDTAQVKAIRSAFNCTTQQARTIIAMSRGILTRQQALDMDIPRTEDASLLSLDSCIKRIRKRFPSLKIRSHYGIGYELDPESRNAVRHILKKCQPQDLRRNVVTIAVDQGTAGGEA